MSTCITIFGGPAYEAGRDRYVTDPVATEPWTVDVAYDGMTGGDGEACWLRVSVSDDTHPEGCTAFLSPAQGLQLLDALTRWAQSPVD